MLASLLSLKFSGLPNTSTAIVYSVTGSASSSSALLQTYFKSFAKLRDCRNAGALSTL